MSNLIFIVMLACLQVEGNPSGGLADNGRTLGPLCISRAVVVDVNRHFGTHYKWHDMQDLHKAQDVFDKYAHLYHSVTAEQIARRWNGGPTGMRKRQTKRYWNLVAYELVYRDLKERYNDALALVEVTR